MALLLAPAERPERAMGDVVEVRADGPCRADVPEGLGVVAAHLTPVGERVGVGEGGTACRPGFGRQSASRP